MRKINTKINRLILKKPIFWVLLLTIGCEASLQAQTLEEAAILLKVAKPAINDDQLLAGARLLLGTDATRSKDSSDHEVISYLSDAVISATKASLVVRKTNQAKKPIYNVISIKDSSKRKSISQGKAWVTYAIGSGASAMQVVSKPPVILNGPEGRIVSDKSFLKYSLN